MNKNHFILISLLSLFTITNGFGQRSKITTIGAVTGVDISQQQVNIKTGNANAEITVYTPSVFRVRIDNQPF